MTSEISDPLVVMVWTTLVHTVVPLAIASLLQRLGFCDGGQRDLVSRNKSAFRLPGPARHVLLRGSAAGGSEVRLLDHHVIGHGLPCFRFI